MKIVVGLGNPGKEYQNHRHNLGFQVVDALGAAIGISFAKEQKKFLSGEGLFEGKKVFLIKPVTWMNLSGEAVVPLLHYYKVGLENLIVLHDDLDLSLGQIRWTGSSGPGGHNGVRSIIELLGSQDFVRLRLGVGRPPQGMDPADYVLQPFDKEELEAVDKLQKNAVESLQEFLKNGLQWVSQKYN